MSAAEHLRCVRKNPEGKAINHNGRMAWQAEEPLGGGGTRCLRGVRKRVADIKHACLPAECRKLRNDAPVVDISAGGGLKIAWNGEYGLLHHSVASYQARASGDSATVTRIALSSRPSRPRLPRRALSATSSKMYRVRNSVVVLTPLNASRSSRLR